jgi:hypothetical protein
VINFIVTSKSRTQKKQLIVIDQLWHLVRYSKWDNLELSDDSFDDMEEEDEETILQKRRRRMMMQVPKKNEEEEESNSEDKGPGQQEPLPTLAALQRAWNTDITKTPRPCSHCFTPNAQYKCSRCQLVQYCNVSCQSSYHPIHKLECIDARQHQKYWGMFDSSSNKSGEEDGVVDDFAVLRARRSSKRRKSNDLNLDAACIYIPLSVCLNIITDCLSRSSPTKGCCCSCCRKSKKSTYGTGWSSQQERW